MFQRIGDLCQPLEKKKTCWHKKLLQYVMSNTYTAWHFQLLLFLCLWGFDFKLARTVPSTFSQFYIPLTGHHLSAICSLVCLLQALSMDAYLILRINASQKEGLVFVLLKQTFKCFNYPLIKEIINVKLTFSSWITN